MRLVEKAAIRPNHCAALPYIGQSHPDGFVDTGTELPGFDNRVYLSVVAVREMARLIGWAAPEELVEARARVAELEARVADLEDEIARTDAVIDAIDVMESRGFTARRKPGRPRRVEEPVG